VDARRHRALLIEIHIDEHAGDLSRRRRGRGKSFFSPAVEALASGAT
jgi:hypothetical protein